MEIRNLGAMSTHLHMIHPETNHLFQKAIMLHGTALSSIFPILNDHRTIIHDFGNLRIFPSSRNVNNYVIFSTISAENLNYSIKNSDSLLQFINEIDPIQLCKNVCKYPSFVRPGTLVQNRVWTVSVERPDAIDPFLTQLPLDIFMNESYSSTIDTLFSRATRVAYIFPFVFITSLSTYFF